MRPLTASMRQALEVLAAHPTAERGVRLSRATDPAIPTVHHSTAWALADRGLADLTSGKRRARITCDGKRAVLPPSEVR